jgi:hypothetical protein
MCKAKIGFINEASSGQAAAHPITEGLELELELEPLP